MPPTSTENEQRRVGTLDAALALLEDIRFAREYLLAETPTSGRVRRVSAILRRLLLDGHLSAVAAPRIGRVTFEIPDTRDLMSSAVGDFVSAGVAPIFGWGSQTFDSFRIVREPPGSFLDLPS